MIGSSDNKYVIRFTRSISNQSSVIYWWFVLNIGAWQMSTSYISWRFSDCWLTHNTSFSVYIWVFIVSVVCFS